MYYTGGLGYGSSFSVALRLQKPYGLIIIMKRISRAPIYRTIRDGDPRWTATSTFTQLLSSGFQSFPVNVYNRLITLILIGQPCGIILILLLIITDLI